MCKVWKNIISINCYIWSDTYWHLLINMQDVINTFRGNANSISSHNDTNQKLFTSRVYCKCINKYKNVHITSDTFILKFLNGRVEITACFTLIISAAPLTLILMTAWQKHSIGPSPCIGAIWLETLRYIINAW